MQNPLAGTWMLERWTARLPGGGSAEPMGPRPRGLLVYSPEGIMSAHYFNSERPALGISLEDISSARRLWLGMEAGEPPVAFRDAFFATALRFNGYAGRYTVDGSRVHHDVEAALYPEWIGKRMTRRFSVDGDLLTLTTEAFRQEDCLVWRRRSPAR